MKKRKQRRAFLILGVIMILCGIGLLYVSAEKTVQVVINGESRLLKTRSSRVADILRGAGIAYNSSDQIRPGLDQRVSPGQRISLNRAAKIRLDPGNGMAPLDYISHQRFGGNILLDAGLRLYPGDQ